RLQHPVAEEEPVVPEADEGLLQLVQGRYRDVLEAEDEVADDRIPDEEQHICGCRKDEEIADIAVTEVALDEIHGCPRAPIDPLPAGTSGAFMALRSRLVMNLPAGCLL